MHAAEVPKAPERPNRRSGAFGTGPQAHRQQRTQKSRAYLWCDPAKVGAKPVIGVNAQSGKANIILLSKELGVALDSAQAQALMDANQAMIEGGGFTASDVSFQLACMKVLGTLEHRFSIKSWRVLDESDETGDRYVQASMQLSVGGLSDCYNPGRRLRSGGCSDQSLAKGTGKWYPALAKMRLGTFSVTALDVSAHDTAAHVRVTVSFHADGHEPWTTAGVSSDLNQAALMAIVDGFHYWLLTNPE